MPVYRHIGLGDYIVYIHRHTVFINTTNRLEYHDPQRGSEEVNTTIFFGGSDFSLVCFLFTSAKSWVMLRIAIMILELTHT